MTDDTAAPENMLSDDEINEIRSSPVETVLGNHVFHLMELAAIHLSAVPPNLNEAQLVIDALAGMLGAVEGRLGEHSALFT
ncbi:MAG: hypothetical protein WCG86_07290, partial [Actinomycetota bacterium]